MAQNVTIAGASYSDVPGVNIPKTGGGTAYFPDVSATTATDGDVASGKIYFKSDGTQSTGTGTGGGENRPTFTAVYDENWDLTSFTCDWTYAECVAFLMDDSSPVVPEGWFVEQWTEQGDTRTHKETTIPNFDDWDNPTEIIWRTVYTDAFPAYEFHYSANALTDPAPADAYEQPTFTENGEYYPETGKFYDMVTVAIPTGTEGTPTATKGTVSNHSVAVTPSVTNTAGVVAGGTHTGTAVTVSASELVSGNKAITSSGNNIDVANYSTASVAAGSATAPSTISGSSATVSTGSNTLTLTKTVSVTPVVSAGYVSSGTAGNASVSLTASVTTQAAQTIHPSTSDQTINSGRYLTGNQTVKAVTLANLTADNIKSGVTIKVGDSTDDDCVASVTGTYSGGGGSSKNTQIVQGTTRTNSSTLTAVGSELTVSKTGTYDIYYSAMRTNTSASYTWGTRLYIDGTAYGNESTTWTNNVQNIHLTNISLTVNQKLRVYGRETRGTSYYIYAPMLAIVES